MGRGGLSTSASSNRLVSRGVRILCYEQPGHNLSLKNARAPAMKWDSGSLSRLFYLLMVPGLLTTRRCATSTITGQLAERSRTELHDLVYDQPGLSEEPLFGSLANDAGGILRSGW